MLSRLNRIATHRDELILEERQRSTQDVLEQGEEEVPEEAADAGDGASA